MHTTSNQMATYGHSLPYVLMQTCNKYYYSKYLLDSLCLGKYWDLRDDYNQMNWILNKIEKNVTLRQI